MTSSPPPSAALPRALVENLDASVKDIGRMDGLLALVLCIGTEVVRPRGEVACDPTVPRDEEDAPSLRGGELYPYHQCTLITTNWVRPQHNLHFQVQQWENLPSLEF